MKTDSKNQGIVYVLTNQAMPGMVKIGMTTRSNMDERMRELFSTGVGLKAGRSDASFPIISQTDNEVVSGLGDTHLDFRASILKDPAAGTISLTTVVHFNNIWGRVYFRPVKPFHKIIMKSLLRRYLKHNQ